MDIIKTKNIISKVINYRLARRGFVKAETPINFTLSVTNKCQSRCLSCNIWDLYRKEPEKLKEELTLDEIEKIFKSVGSVFFFNISGGCPFLRKDLPEIVELACIHLKPQVIHIPTNALAVERTFAATEKILNIMASYNPSMGLQIKPSFDGVGELHDEVRGVKGNFNKLIRLVHELKELKLKYSNLHIGLGTVISRNNVDGLKETMDYVDKLNVDSYISEIAENRDEMFNLEDPIAPTLNDFQSAMKGFKAHVHSKLKFKKGLARITDAFRLVYYDLAVKIFEKKEQVIPCYGGISNVHIDPYGNVWPCCVLGNKQSMGNLKEHDYKFDAIWNSRRASQVRTFIKQKKCHCPLANQTYANILCSFRKMIQVFGYLLPFRLNGAGGTSRSSGKLLP